MKIFALCLSSALVFSCRHTQSADRSEMLARSNKNAMTVCKSIKENPDKPASSIELTVTADYKSATLVLIDGKKKTERIKLDVGDDPSPTGIGEPVLIDPISREYRSHFYISEGDVDPALTSRLLLISRQGDKPTQVSFFEMVSNFVTKSNSNIQHAFDPTVDHDEKKLHILLACEESGVAKTPKKTKSSSKVTSADHRYITVQAQRYPIPSLLPWFNEIKKIDCVDECYAMRDGFRGVLKLKQGVDVEQCAEQVGSLKFRDSKNFGAVDKVNDNFNDKAKGSSRVYMMTADEFQKYYIESMEPILLIKGGKPVNACSR